MKPRQENTDQKTLTIKELMVSLKEVDALRFVKELSDSEREALELTSVALRDAERLAVAKMQKELIKEMEAQTVALNAQAKAIRERVTRMNKTSKLLDTIESAIKTAVKIVAAIAKW